MKIIARRNILLLITALFIVLYWLSVFTQTLPVEELVSGYTWWFLSFPVPDFYIALCALFSVYYSRSKPKLSGLFATMAGSGLIFLGLYALAYGYQTGLLFQLTTNEIIEIGIKLYCLTAGPYVIFGAWKSVQS